MVNQSLDLSKKDIDPQITAEKALHDEQVFSALLEGLSPATKKTTIRNNGFKALMLLAKSHPDVLFPHWDYLVELLKSDNSFSQYPAVHLIATLVPADREGRFDAILDVYYDRLDDESVMIAGHIAGVSGQIARAKPHLRARITKKLLNIDATHFEQERKDLIKGYAIESFDEYFEESGLRERIIEFARAQLDCTSPKTKKIAKKFLKKWSSAVV